jgi:hypothetical protein
MRISRLGMCAVVLVAGGCAGPSPAELVVTVELSACPTYSSDCYTLRVPDTDVTAVGSNGVSLARTDESGVARIRVGDAGHYRVEARSFIIEGDKLSQTVTAKDNESKEILMSGKLRMK